MKLNIQYFADENLDVNTVDLNSIVGEIEKYSGDIEGALTAILQLANQVLADESVKAVAGEVLDNVVGAITPLLGDFAPVVQGFGDFLKYAIETYNVIDEQIANEIKAWGDGLIANVKKVSNAATTVATGYGTGDLITDLSAAGLKGLEAGGDAATAVVKYVTAGTGKTIPQLVGDGLEIAGEITKKAFQAVKDGGTLRKIAGIFFPGLS